MEPKTCSCGNEYSALYEVVAVGEKQEIVNELLKCKADINVADCNGRTALHHAMLNRRELEIIQELLGHGADVNVVDVDGNTPLLLATGHQEAVIILAFRAFKFDEDHISISYTEKDAEIVKELLKCGADINAINEDGNTLLNHSLNFKVTVGWVKELLNSGADVNIANCDGVTPLHRAMCVKSNLEIIKELLKHTTNINATNKCGDTPLYKAITARIEVDVIRALLKHGADIDVTNACGFTPLSAAVSAYVEILEELLMYGTNNNFDFMKCSKFIGVLAPLQEPAEILIKYSVLHVFESDDIYLLNLYSYRKESSYNMLISYIEDCISEIVKMKATKIGEGLSLHDFVTIKNLNIPLYSDNKSTQAITQERTLIESYPVYSNILLEKVKCALDRGTLLNELKDICVYCKKDSSPTAEKIVLNPDCLSVIIKYLPNEDLDSFMQAFCISVLNDYDSHLLAPYASYFENTKIKGKIRQNFYKQLQEENPFISMEQFHGP